VSFKALKFEQESTVEKQALESCKRNKIGVRRKLEARLVKGGRL